MKFDSTLLNRNNTFPNSVDIVLHATHIFSLNVSLTNRCQLKNADTNLTGPLYSVMSFAILWTSFLLVAPGHLSLYHILPCPVHSILRLWILCIRGSRKGSEMIVPGKDNIRTYWSMNKMLLCDNSHWLTINWGYMRTSLHIFCCLWHTDFLSFSYDLMNFSSSSISN